MRVTEGATYRTLENNLNSINNDLFDLRTQGTTQSKLNKASDDSASVAPVFNTRTQIRESERYVATMDKVGDNLNYSDTQMDSLENIMQRVQEIAIASGNATSEADRQTYSNEVGQLMSQMTSIGNTQLSGNYLFAGYNNDEAPFTANAGYDPLTFDESDTSTWPVSYTGDNFPQKKEIAPGELVESTITGNELFMGVTNEDFASDPTTTSSGQANLFNTLAKLQQGLLNNDADALSGSILSEIETASEQNREIRGTAGVIASHVEDATDQQESAQIDLAQILSRYQDADAIEVYNDIIQKENAFEAALSVTSRISEISILDYL
jgi:flagellar hook-associated protein 3 FlgL